MLENHHARGHKPSCISTKHRKKLHRMIGTTQQRLNTTTGAKEYYKSGLSFPGSTRSASITAEEQQGPRLKERHVPHGNQHPKTKPHAKEIGDDTKDPIHVVRIRFQRSIPARTISSTSQKQYHSRSWGPKQSIQNLQQFWPIQKSGRRQTAASILQTNHALNTQPGFFHKKKQ
ncbi:hypothetical protein Nepgr_032294 [Nepenthes gracilis]|uniref:Uncharacterized protein n=1 Tax=Nepenthes gracilis TaxID=150966 RepID=A0AAD3Y865_NEPGR|nr:hypothetical protein Nepgr_032294 [Nepenthes gracilis]